MVIKLKNRINSAFNRFFRFFLNQKSRKKLKNKDFTLISSNCNGCLILHDLGLKYNSPFVNLFICADDYIKLLQNFTYYMSKELTFVQNEHGAYPLALLGDVFIHFVHYKNEREAADKWNARKKRMNMSNCYVLFTDRDGCTEEHLEIFDKLPFQNKAVLTNKAYPSVLSAHYVPGFEDQECVGSLHKYSAWFGKKYYDAFDYVSWFNESASAD